MADGIMTQQEESRLREFRDRLALADTSADRKAAAELERASTERLTLDARLATLAARDPDTHLNELAQSLQDSGLNPDQRTALLVRAGELPWKAPSRADPSPENVISQGDFATVAAGFRHTV